MKKFLKPELPQSTNFIVAPDSAPSPYSEYVSVSPVGRAANFIRLRKSVLRSRYARGFSLVELLVAISIFAIISASLVFNYNTYAGKEELGNATNQLALDIREAQAFAMGVRATAGGQYPSYGIRFAIGNPYEYLVYADLNQNGVYDLGGTCGEANSECVKVTEMPQKIKIKSICGMTSPTVSSVDCPGPLSKSQYFDVLFTRPNPEAAITGSPSGVPVSFDTAEITLVAVKGYTKKVTIASTGQIVVK